MIRLYYCLLLMGSNSLYYARIYNINLGGKKNNMGAIEILLISIGLAMDAFAVSVCKGLAMKKMSWKKAITIGLYFGAFQAIMPTIGFSLGTTFERFITNVDHWIAFILLVGIGINMVKEAFNKESENRNDNVDVKTMLVLSIATSIDALAIGITFACLKIQIVMPVITIGLITFIISVIGVKIGNRFGDKYGKKAEIMGGVILILLGIKILLEHLKILQYKFLKYIIIKTKKGENYMKKSLIVIIVIVLLLGGLLIGSYNGMVSKREAVDTAYSNLDVTLQRRADLIPNLVNTVKGYTSHETAAIEQVTNARTKYLNSSSTDEKIEANNEISKALSNLLVVVENYPDLKASTNFTQLSDELSGTENRIAVARRDYNEAVKTYNLSIKKFPNSILAGMFGFENATYFEASESSKDVPNVSFE